MNSTTVDYIIPEYNAKVLDGLVNHDLTYLNKPCFNANTANPPFKVRELKDNKVEIENTSYSGVIQLDKIRIHFSTKVKTNLFYMLSFLKDEKSFFYDPEIVIDIKEGSSFFDILGRLFLNELEEIFKRGLYKKYVRKEENAKFLKGRLLIHVQIQNEIKKCPNFFCSYDDLTYNNLENQIVLRAATLLIPLIRFNDAIKRDLIRYSLQLRELVSLINIVPEDCEKVQYCKLNEDYETIISLSKLILQNCFIRSVHRGASKGFNFIVNMNKVYEDFITEIIEEIVSEDAAFKDYVAEKQERFDSLVREKTIITKPDIIVRKKASKEYSLVIDAKYKRQANNTDYYQVIAYSLAIPTTKACCLIYPESEPIEAPVLTIDTRPFGPNGREIKLHTVKVDLCLDNGHEEMSFNEYIRRVKNQIRNKLVEFL